MVHGDINMNVARDGDENPCIDPMAIMHYDMGHSEIISDATKQTNIVVDDTQLDFQPIANVGTSYGGPAPISTIIQCKLFFLIAAHKTVQTGKEFVAVARITRGHENPFVNAQGTAYHYVPEVKHPQFNTSIPLLRKELAEATCDDRAFAVHKTTGTSCAPAGTYLVYRLKRSEPGIRNLRFEAIWDWGDGYIGKASYDFVFLTAHDDCIMKPYTTLQKKLLNELWPEWEKYIDC
ncbi:hypothetical protein F4782DRAFT_526588 [Xylaria castorea]|nr:hypothetical protein F4782DRAFT_526588 [Xylaria castorea]